MKKQAKGITTAKRNKPNVGQGWGILLPAAFGIIVGLAPLWFIIQPNSALNFICSISLSIFWAVVLGAVFTYWFSTSLHDRVKKLRPQLIRGTNQKNKKGPPIRLPWMPFWIGIFERIFFALIIGFGIEGSGAFIAGWIGIKMASGWGTWSSGEAYGRAVFFAGLLGSALSLLFGISSGLILQRGISLASSIHIPAIF